jgi:hypothetical protein
MTKEQDTRLEGILDRLANEAEEHLHVDVEGRRSATRALLDEIVKVLTAAQHFDSAAYATSIEPNGVVVGDYVVVKVGHDGNVIVAPVDIMAPKLPRPMVKYNSRRRAWEHRLYPDSVHPVHAVLDVVLPVVFEAIRRERGMPRERPAPTAGVGRPVSQFRPSNQMDPRG